MSRIRSCAITTVALLLVAGLWPSTAAAQRRAVPRTRVSRPPASVRTQIYVRPYVYRPYYYGYYNRPLFWGPYGWGLGLSYTWGGYPWQYGPYGYPFYGPRYLASSVRIQVTPKTAEVFVDGYFAGIVDDFDGVFQRLDLEPGQHEIVVWEEGFRAVRQRLYLEPGRSYRIAETLRPLGPGEPGEPRPAPLDVPEGPPPPFYGGQGQDRPLPPAGRPPLPPDREPPQPVRPPAPGMEARAPQDAGELVMRIQPAGATVLIDGEEWRAPGDQQRLVVRLAPGEHRVEVRKEGYQTFTTSVYITAGEPVNLNVSLLQEMEGR